MPIINNITVSESKFTRMQELGSAFILERSFKGNKRFNSPESIVKDSITKLGLEKIFKSGTKSIFNFLLPLQKKSAEGKWITTFYLQHKKMIQTFADAKFKVFNREGGFMEFISDLIKTKFKIPRKDAWNPADIWLIQEPMKFRNVIRKEMEGDSATQTISELNTIMRDMFEKRQVVGISLKLISGQQAKYEEINVDEKFFAKLEDKLGGYNYTLSKIKLNLNLKLNKAQFETQDTRIVLKDSSGKDVFDFQVKGNTSSRLANLKFEPSEIGVSKARLGKSPLDLVQKLSENFDKNIFNSATRSSSNFPVNEKEFKKRKGEFISHYKVLLKNKKFLDKSIKYPTEKEFESNMIKVFSDDLSHIANVKLQQLYFVSKVLGMKEKQINDFLTDLLFLSQKKGRAVFDFGLCLVSSSF